jgi:hypothetical protein
MRGANTLKSVSNSARLTAFNFVEEHNVFMGFRYSLLV